MTDHLYYTRLRFDGKRGIAKMHGMTVSLTVGPDLGDGPVWSIDYRPEIGFGQVRPRCVDPQRDMTPDEVHAADAFLRGLTTLPEIER